MSDRAFPQLTEQEEAELLGTMQRWGRYLDEDDELASARKQIYRFLNFVTSEINIAEADKNPNLVGDSDKVQFVAEYRRIQGLAAKACGA